MASLIQNIITLVQSVGTDIKALTGKIGDLTNLNTSNKNSVVEAVNEIKAGTTNTFIQQTEPASASPYIWYKTDASGNVIDILKG